MGQKLGKATYVEDARPFLNLSFAAIEAMWDTHKLDKPYLVVDPIVKAFQAIKQ